MEIGLRTWQQAINVEAYNNVKWIGFVGGFEFNYLKVMYHINKNT
jgi:hypothetical protein